MMAWRCLAVLVTSAAALSVRPSPLPWCERIDSRGQTAVAGAHFARLLDEVAAGWNAGDARRAAACFTEDAAYSAAGDSLARHGRAALYDFFGGKRGRSAPMTMTWHHHAFEPAAQIGFGEYTFGYAGYQAHGVTVIQLRHGRIARWREYELASAVTWAEFTRANPF
jgi:ketosteroid isomerase-like protein